MNVFVIRENTYILWLLRLEERPNTGGIKESSGEKGNRVGEGEKNMKNKGKEGGELKEK